MARCQQLNISLVAYGIDGPDPSLVFVRVPTERGRWVLTDRCVAEVACEWCGAIVGEPCRRGHKGKFHGHGVGTHAWRRDLWQRQRYAVRRSPQPKLRVRAEDLADANADAEEN